MNEEDINPENGKEKIIDMLDSLSGVSKESNVKLLEMILTLEQKFIKVREQSTETSDEVMRLRKQVSEKELSISELASELETKENVINHLNDDLADYKDVVLERDQWRDAFVAISDKLTQILSASSQEATAIQTRISGLTDMLGNDDVDAQVSLSPTQEAQKATHDAVDDFADIDATPAEPARKEPMCCLIEFLISIRDLKSRSATFRFEV